ncbi:hypothetical protein STEG23_028593 [Scotinomys teguina]
MVPSHKRPLQSEKDMTQRMALGNDSSVKEFILLGLTQQPELQLPLFFLFLGIYVVSIVGNLGLIILIILNPHLHTPMYYFLFNLAFIDLCYSSVITPKMLVSFVKQNIISHAECMTQLFFFCFFVIDECYILTAMAYDRYAAICKPLLYQVTMSHRTCHLMLVGVYVMGFVGAMAHTGSMLSLTFCDGNIINHYMCDIPPLQKLSCTNIAINEMVVFIVVGVNVIVPTLTIFISYTLILFNILGIHSAEAMTPGMASENDSSVKEFILLGLTQQPELQLPLFFLFLGIYVVSMVGNLGLIILIVLNPHLHTPMYYFLFNLAFTDLCYSSVITPKMLVSFVKLNIISHAECMTQLFFFAFFVIDECYILTSMAYDRYAAICKPLLYQVTMSYQVCHLMMVGVYVMGFVGAMAHVVCMLRLTFCDSNIINHYMCDLPPLLKLSCTSTTINELVLFIVVGVNVTVPTLTIFISYTLIISNILRIRSAEGRSKAFSTCGTHVIAVSFFFGALVFMYLKPSSASVDEDKVSTIFYTIVSPMVNPFIYSLRNKDVHIALRKTLKKRMFA